ncbi:hypothetical protein ABFS82_10G117300 [Erythranthe guttata]|uniref:uncharacterized protein LOC105971525 n=1 Tax=Erythranthe guttata TaxID=4155 RepID=UPI00064DA8F4|nr:PREDICTED: uncharacterized protein LOC105971525 [Erythranthe guttata]|eukprot:XP_012851832.1 PREDICTED: uncharacterized protein LOC105971525 [Erythranthe guttata]
MSTGAAGDGLLRGMFEGCISGGDMGVQRRPYHKNCKCAMHKARGHCAHSSSRYANVSYPIRRSWSEGSLALMNASPAAGSTPPSPSSPVVAAGEISRTQTQLVLFREEDEEGDGDDDDHQVVEFSSSKI